MLRDDLPLPDNSELDVVRHFTRLSQRTFGIDTVFYPLGSCTMKYNPRVNDAMANLPELRDLHPFAPDELAQGALPIMYELERSARVALRHGRVFAQSGGRRARRADGAADRQSVL